MPRQSRGRPAARPAPAPSQQQSRGAHTAAAPTSFGSAPRAPPAAPPVAAQTTAPQQPGMLAQMAATAGSVAVGSTIGHGLSSMLFGGNNHAAAAPAEVPVAQQPYQNQAPSCDVQARDLTTCLEKADMQSCSWYLEQLKACQAAARPY